MKTPILISVLLLRFTASLLPAAELAVNGTCEVGTCTSPAVIASGQSVNQPFNLVYTLANGDRFQIQGLLSAADTNGSSWSTANTSLAVTYLGNNSAAGTSNADVLTVDQLYAYYVSAPGTGTFGEAVYGGFSGPFAPGSSCSFHHLDNGIALPTLGPFSPPGLFNASQEQGVAVSITTNSLMTDVRTTVTFGAGSGAGATVLLNHAPIFGRPAISAGGVVPVFSSTNTVQPGSWASIYGSNLAGIATVWNGDFPTSLGGVSVTIDSKPAYLWYVSPTQINFQVPDDLKTGPVSVAVTTLGGTATSTVTLAPYAPSFSLLSAKYPAAIVITPGSPGNSGGGYDIIGPAGAFSYPSRPVSPGETLILYGVGFGPTTSTVPAGQAFSGAAPVPVLPTVTIGGMPAIVNFTGIVEAGLYQLNVVVPAAGSGDQPVLATINGVATQNNIYVTLQQ